MIMFKFRNVLKTASQGSRVEIIKSKFIASLIGVALLIVCAVQVTFAQQPTCSSCGDGFEVNCTHGHLSGGTDCRMNYDGPFPVCYLDNANECYGDLTLGNCRPDVKSGVRLQLDVATIENLAKLNPHHAFALAAIVGRKYTLYEGHLSKVRWVPVKVSNDQLKYWLNLDSESSKSYFAEHKKKLESLVSVGEQPIEIDVMLVGNDLTLTITSASKLSQGKTLKLLLKDENIIKQASPTVTNFAQGQKKKG